MTRSLTLSSLVSLMALGCAMPDAGLDEDLDIYQGAPEGRIVGVVTDVDGAPLAGVTVTLPSGQSATTDAQGAYLIADVEPDVELVARFTADGYNTAYNDIAVDAYQTQTANAILRPVHVTYQFDSADGGVFTDGAGQLTFAPHGIIDEGGAVYDGAVVLDLTFVDVNADGTDWIGPGDFRGVRTTGEEGLLVSAGFFEATLRTPAGAPLNVNPDAPVALELDVPEGLGPQMLDAVDSGSIPLWWFDPDTAIWVEDGAAAIVDTEDGQKIVGELSHFTWWNADWWYDDQLVCVHGQVVDMAGNPIPSAEITLVGEDWRLGAPYTVTAVADQDGYFDVGEAFELQEVLITVEAVIDGTTITQTITWTTGDSISKYGDVCEDMPPIELPSCVLGGDVRLTDRQVAGIDIGVGTETSIGLGGVTDESNGLGQFFEAVASASCYLPWQEVETGSCSVLSELNDLPWQLPTQTAPLNAGNRLTVSNPTESFRYDRVQGTFGPEYVASLTTPPSNGAQYRLTVQGSDELPGYNQSLALAMPADMAVTSPSPLLPIDINRDADLTVAYTGSGNASGVYAVIEPSSSTQGLVCHFDDTGSFTIPASSLALLEGGDASVHVVREDTRFHDMPNGYPARTIGASAQTVNAYIR